MYLYGEKRELVINYVNKVMEKKSLDVGPGLEIVKTLANYINQYNGNSENNYDKLANILWDENTKSIEDVFEGNKYGVLELLFGELHAKNVKEYWNRSTEYTYSVGYYRRSYRSKKTSKLYFRKNIEKLVELIYLVSSEFSLDKYFQSNKEDYNNIIVISDIIALELDNNNEFVFEKVKEVIYSDNNTSIVTREIIKGLLMSKNPESHRIIGELLIAAKLQEGLRQTIVESLDEGSKEGFIYILKLILDNNLMRFSSVARAFTTWTGLFLEVEKPKIVAKCFDAAYNCLIDENYKNTCIESDDNLLIYIGIWSVGFDEIQDTDDILNKLLHSDMKYKKLVALQFLSTTQFKEYKHKVACGMLEGNDLEIIGLAIKNLFDNLNCYSLNYNTELVKSYATLSDNCYGTELFNKLKRILDMMPKKELEYTGSVFPWINFSITSAEIMEKMLLSVGTEFDSAIVDTLIDYKGKMSVDTRQIFVDIFLKEPKNMKQKLTLIESCGDRGQAVRENAFKIVDSMELSDEDYILVENLLQYKSGDLRKSAIKLLLKQSSEKIIISVKRLVDSNNENKKMAAIDIVNAIEGDQDYKNIFDKCLNYISSMDDISQKGKLFTKNIVKDTKDVKNLKNGFGLYDPLKNFEPVEIKRNKNFNISSKFVDSHDEIEAILVKFSNLIDDNRDFEYETLNWDDTKISITLGGSDYLQAFDRNNSGLDNYPIADKIREFVKVNNIESWDIIKLDFYIRIIDGIRYRTYANWYEDLLKDNFNFEVAKKLCKTVNKIKYYKKIETYINLLVDEIPKVERFEIGKSVAEYLYTIIPDEKHYEDYLKNENQYYHSKGFVASGEAVSYWLSMMRRNVDNDEKFKEYFTIGYNYYRASQYNVNGMLEIYNFGHGLEIGIIDENEAFKELMERPLSSRNLSALNYADRYERKKLSKCKQIMELSKIAIDVIAQIEVSRGELDTEVSNLASNINKCYGVNIFASIILASEKDTYIRGYNFVSGDCTKKQMFSHLLKCCYPKDGESAKTLEEYLKDKKLSSKQLIEAAMYSPQWLDIVSEYLGYEGLKSACWYFHAHVNDNFSDEKSAIVARYTPISSNDLKDGAFDQQWFVDAYNTLGEKKFKLVYDSAKYIAGGVLHKRSQLFVDATLGNLDIKEVKNRIFDKRNKDYLLTYGLIPVKNKKDVLERYEYIHQFIKESKQFGAQRQASEGRSGNIALLNLARNAGFSDVNRLTWNMETIRIESVLSYLKPKAIEDVELQLVIDKLGTAEVICTKAGKALKNIPAKLKKNEYVMQLKELKKSLKDQYVRARQSFEISMENGETFNGEELINLCKNPVLSPIIKNLVFKSGDFIGYIYNDTLVNYKNEVYKLNKKDDVIIAHPIHFYKAACWQDYQKDIFSKEITQPFKQVFRELYMPNSDEIREQTLSRRYAGHQVQPRKTMALLKTRGWIASNEEGLQKVYYKENIIATIYAIADWFSPADMESPTIEFVRFEDRKTYKPITIDKISDLIFSEVMRDVDLVVSVAHVGGVDPEASLSTIEIRTVIVEEILKLMKISNVELKGNHAYITGVHGEYTVHLGSGVVHKMGKGSINIIPVHSSHRGKIFLPFIDSDPKSAEILSKIILLAEDMKIKDPTVLEQITSIN